MSISSRFVDWYASVWPERWLDLALRALMAITLFVMLATFLGSLGALGYCALTNDWPSFALWIASSTYGAAECGEAWCVAKGVL